MSNLFESQDQESASTSKIREEFNFEVTKEPVVWAEKAEYDDDGVCTNAKDLATGLYVLKRSDRSGVAARVGKQSVTEQYHPHTTDDVVALGEAAQAVFGDLEVECFFKDGQYVIAQPTAAERRQIHGTADSIWQRIVIKASYDMEAFKAAIGFHRDACSNLVMIECVAGVSASIQHRSNLREDMDKLIANFEMLKDGWEGIVDKIQKWATVNISLEEFLKRFLGEEPEWKDKDAGVSGRKRTVWLNKRDRIIERIDEDRRALGQPTLLARPAVNAWEVYNAAQGYIQHDTTMKGKPGSLERACRSIGDKRIRKIENIVDDLVAEATKES